MFRDFLNSVSDLRHTFDRMLKMEPHSSELKQLIEKYEARAQKYYEPTGVVSKLRPYMR